MQGGADWFGSGWEFYGKMVKRWWKKKWNAPNTCQCYDGVNDAAAKSRLTAEEPRDEIKTEKTDASPVQRADDRNN